MALAVGVDSVVPASRSPFAADGEDYGDGDAVSSFAVEMYLQAEEGEDVVLGETLGAAGGKGGAEEQDRRWLLGVIASVEEEDVFAQSFVHSGTSGTDEDDDDNAEEDEDDEDDGASDHVAGAAFAMMECDPQAAGWSVDDEGDDSGASEWSTAALHLKDASSGSGDDDLASLGTTSPATSSDSPPSSSSLSSFTSAAAITASVASAPARGVPRGPAGKAAHARAAPSSAASAVDVGNVALSDNDLVAMDIAEIQRLSGMQLTKAEERALKRLRRRVKNKLSAASSRQKKRDYLSSLEERVETVTAENVALKARIGQLEAENRALRTGAPLPAAAKRAEPVLASTTVPPGAATASVIRSDVPWHAAITAPAMARPQPAGRRANGHHAVGGAVLMAVLLSFGFFFPWSTSPAPATEQTSPSTTAADRSDRGRSNRPDMAPGATVFFTGRRLLDDHVDDAALPTPAWEQLPLPSCADLENTTVGGPGQPECIADANADAAWVVLPVDWPRSSSPSV